MHRKKLDKLKIALDGVYESPLFEGIHNFQKEREELLKASSETFGTQIVQSHIKDMENALGSTSMQDIFNTKDDYLKYTTPILNEIKNHDYEELQKALGVDSYEKYIKDDISHTFKSLDIVNDTLKRINEPSGIDLEKYTSSFTEAFNDLSNNKNLLKSSQNLLGISEEINEDKFKYDMKKLKREIPQYIPSPKLPNIPNYGKKIIESLDAQKGLLDMLSSHMEVQNKISEEQVKISRLSSDKQIEKLDKQIKQNKVSSEQQNKDTNKMVNITIFIALLSIGIAIWTSVSFITKADEIYDKENKSSNQQHNELLNHIDTIKNKDLDNKLIEILKAILETMEKKNTKPKNKDVEKWK